MTTKEFEAQVKVGDKVVLRNDLKNNTVYGGESYILPSDEQSWGMVPPGSTVTVSHIFPKSPKGRVEFYINGDTGWYYTAEMVDHVVREKTDTVENRGGMDKQEFLKIAKIGDTAVLRSDLKVDETYGDDCYTQYMFNPGSTGTISDITVGKNGEVFVYLKEDDEYYRYTPAMVEKVIANDHNLKCGETSAETSEGVEQPVKDKHIEYLQTRLADLKSEIEVIEGMIKRLSGDE